MDVLVWKSGNVRALQVENTSQHQRWLYYWTAVYINYHVTLWEISYDKVCVADSTITLYV